MSAATDFDSQIYKVSWSVAQPTNHSPRHKIVLDTEEKFQHEEMKTREVVKAIFNILALIFVLALVERGIRTALEIDDDDIGMNSMFTYCSDYSDNEGPVLFDAMVVIVKGIAFIFSHEISPKLRGFYECCYGF